MQSERRLSDLEKVIGSLTNLFRRGADSAGSSSYGGSRASPVGANFPMLAQFPSQAPSPTLYQGQLASNTRAEPALDPSEIGWVDRIDVENQEPNVLNLDIASPPPLAGLRLQNALAPQMETETSGTILKPAFRSSKESLYMAMSPPPPPLQQSNGRREAYVSTDAASVASSLPGSVSKEGAERFENLLNAMESSMNGFNHLLDRLERNRT